MPRKTTREALLEQRRQIDERLKRLEVRERELTRKQETRRKIIAGALALEHAERNSEWGAEFYRVVSRYVDRPQDRGLFGLAPKEEAPQEQQPDTLSERFQGAKSPPDPGAF